MNTRKAAFGDKLLAVACVALFAIGKSRSLIAAPAHEEGFVVDLAECDDVSGLSVGNVVAVCVKPERIWAHVGDFRNHAFVQLIFADQSLAKFDLMRARVLARHKEGAAIIHVVETVFGTPFLG